MKLSLSTLVSLALAAALCLPALARAEESGLRDFCAERPGSATPPCIVNTGHLMLEVDGLDATRARIDGGGWLQTTSALAPHLRVGLTDRIEAGINIQPFVQQRAGDRVTGVGDATANLKISLRNPGGDGLSLAVLPYVSIPAAQKHLGAGGFQGGLIIPVSAALPAGFTLGIAPEADVLRSEGGGKHQAYLNVVSLAHAVVPGLNGAVEIVSSVGEGPDRHIRQTMAGANLAWMVPGKTDLQLDVGANAGLNRQAPALRVYFGVSKRF
jgi:hypothetical protein